jgi:hypothetical protein
MEAYSVHRASDRVSPTTVCLRSRNGGLRGIGSEARNRPALGGEPTGSRVLTFQ